MLSTRSDWLALETIFIHYDTNGRDGKSQSEWRVKLLRTFRELMTASCDRLTEIAVNEGHLDMRYMADELKEFYEAIPKDTFRKV